jgi:response regulator of citrate/malate metabolism
MLACQGKPLGGIKMTQGPLRVLVVDDDFMIAKMHGKYIDSQSGYQLIGIVYTYEQALSAITELNPDLILLDVYLPVHSGIDLLRSIRNQNSPCDIILITASKEREIVEEGFRLGVFDYLIKPFDLEHLTNSLIKYAQFRSHLSSNSELNQNSLDDLKKLRTSKSPSAQLQKGIDLRTLDRIKHYLKLQPDFQNSDEIAHSAGVSRSTVRNYLIYLTEENIVEELLQYGTVGRPQRLYRLLK